MKAQVIPLSACSGPKSVAEKNFLQTPSDYRSRWVGNFLPGRKNGGREFTGGDTVKSYWG